MYILGISALYHDSAAAISKDGRILYAVEEERFTRIKHDNQFPFQAVKLCLAKAGISINEVEYITYYEKPLLKFERVLENFVQTYPFSLRLFLRSIPEWLGQKIKIGQIIRQQLGYKGKLFFIPHHFSHAAASFYPSPFLESAILTVDGVGEYQTTGLWHGKKDRIIPLQTINFPHSLGLLYSTFTAFLGFKVNEDEYKVMGLAAYGKPAFVNDIYQTIDVKDDGGFCLNLKYFSFHESVRMWSKKFEQLFGKPRLQGQPITERDRNLAASIQKVTETIYFTTLKHLHQITQCENLCIGGGVALNALANGKIYQKTPFKNIYIFGPAGDSGGAVGSALFTYHYILQNQTRHGVGNLCLGFDYGNDEIELMLREHTLNYIKTKDKNELVEKTAALLTQNKVIGWFQGKMEFGPRALGSRSILANPKPAFIKKEVNKIKMREQFRPFAGSMLQEKIQEYFEVPENNHFSPFMNFCFTVKTEKKNELAAIVHRDNTCRIQTVNEENGLYYKLIKRFYELTDVPCLLNTSFNVRGEPIVESPKQAIEDFLRTKMDYMVIGDFLVSRP